MREFVKLPLILFAIALIAGALLGITNALTKEPIKAQHELALKNAREELFKDSEFEMIDESPIYGEYENVENLYEAKKGGDVAGYIVTLTKDGYGGAILLNIGVTTDGVITGVIVGTNSETPGLGAKAGEPEFAGQFPGKGKITLVKGDAVAEDEVSAITAATITSTAVVDGANQAIEITSELMGGQ